MTDLKQLCREEAVLYHRDGPGAMEGTCLQLRHPAGLLCPAHAERPWRLLAEWR
jgi:hypothetical protein